MTISTATDLHAVAEQMTSGGRGLLAADESIPTMSQRLEAAGVTASDIARRDYRQLLLTAPGLAATVSGIILCDETFGQSLTDGRRFPEAAHELGVLPGIKVDTGTVACPGVDGALLTQGLDGLDERLESYAARGAAFAKWRAVLSVETLVPQVAEGNAAALAAYAAACQRHGIVPVVEPEVLAAGSHDLVDSARATRMILEAVFAELDRAGVDLSGIVLKPNLVTPGLDSQQVSPRTIATVTYDVLRATVPAAVTGIAFLSGGHPTHRVTAALAELNRIEDAPWHLTFSFGRALVNDALATWEGSPAHVTAAQRALLANCREAAGAAGCGC
ncbi:class I fructose-bisphosphate aldolase [Nocardioides sp.]|uniref:class I fructose-bisphosphate aldolase n=1 Tax=Nocardioides sp. TaxID=35761 RepID=UPI003529B21E